MKMRPSAPQSRERGAALILVVWAVGLMAVFAASAARDASLDNKDARLYRGSIAAKALAEGGLRYGTYLWRTGDERVLGGKYFCSTPTGLLQLEVAPASSRISANLAQEPLLTSLFIELGADRDTAETAAAHIADYRDADYTARPKGGEKRDYMQAGLSYGPRDDIIENIAEIAFIPGVPNWLYAAASPHLTLSADGAVPDIEFSDPVVKAAVENMASASTARPAARRQSRPGSRSVSRRLSSGSQYQSGPIRVRASARSVQGGYHVLDAEIVGKASGSQAPRMVRLDNANVRDGDFEMAEGTSIETCGIGTASSYGAAADNSPPADEIETEQDE